MLDGVGGITTVAVAATGAAVGTVRLAVPVTPVVPVTPLVIVALVVPVSGVVLVVVVVLVMATAPAGVGVAGTEVGRKILLILHPAKIRAMTSKSERWSDSFFMENLFLANGFVSTHLKTHFYHR